MKIFASSWLRAVLLAAGALSAATVVASPLPPPGPQPTPDAAPPLWVVVSDHQQEIQIRLPMGVDWTSSGAQMSAPPRHGAYRLEAGQLYYELPSDFLGRDSMSLILGEVEQIIQVRIVPRQMAFAGRFDGVYQGVGLWDNRSRTFLICGEPAEGDPELPCERLPVRGLDTHRALVPLVWPDKFGGETPALFDAQLGRILRLIRFDDHLAFSQSYKLPEDIYGGWPIFGAFRSKDKLELAIVKEDGIVSLVHDGEISEIWPGQLAVPAGDALVWPIRLPRASLDAVALVEPESGHLIWLQLDPSVGSTSGEEPSFDQGDFRRPVAWTMSPVYYLEPGPEVFYLEKGKNDELELVPGRYQGSKPQTIPVKFPDDPPGG